MFCLSQFDRFLSAFDGVLLDSDELTVAAFGELYADHGSEVRGMVEAYQRAHPGEMRHERIPMLHRSLLGEELTRAEILEECDRLGDIVLKDMANCPLKRDIAETLEVLGARGIAGHIVASAPPEEVATILARKRLTRHFSSIHGAPLPRDIICEAIFAANRADRTRCLYVGNTMADYRCATNAGAHFIGIGDFATSPFPFGTQVVESLGEVFLEIATARIGRPVVARSIELGRRFRAA